MGPAGFNALQASVAVLVEQFTNVERLAQVGIPTVRCAEVSPGLALSHRRAALTTRYAEQVYGIHLKQCVSLFLFTLPSV